MRRLDDGHAQRPPPFRVLAVPDGNYLSPTAIPPPPRAPEPYKIAPSTTSSSRAHRRSSFVIIADSRPASPEIRSPSPTLATGRVSPFRGRGFKGPPPRSKSRPQSPENGGTRRRGRSERRVSVSQQNSPRRSLIPQPTRQRSTSLSKSTDRLNSPKLGRRADSRVRLNITDSRNRLNASGNNNSTVNLSNRRQVSRTPSKLSPIQGTPTKPERTPQVRRKDGSKESAKSSLNKDSSTSSSRNAWNAKKQSQERISGVGNGSSKERLTSPSKIPLKTNRVSSNSLNPPRFITVSDQSNEKGKKVIDKGSKKEVRVYDEKSNGSGQSGKRSDTNDKGSSNDRATDLNLIDLLKRTSGATGTSSVVNTTATTAVQPLHIDANAILVEKGDSDKRNHTERTKSQQDLSNGKSSNSLHDDSANKPMQTSQSISGEERRQINNQATKSTKTNAAGNQNKVKSGLESRNDSSASLEKNNTGSQSNKVTSKATKNTGTQRSNKNQNGAIDHGTTKFATNDNKISEESSALQTASASNPSKINENDLINDSTKSVDGQRRIISNASVSVKQEDSKTSSKSVNESETKTNTNVSTVIANNTVPSQTKTVSKTNSVSSAVGVVSNDSKSKVNSGGVKTRTNNHGSGTSLKSSAGASVDSIESVRSTDTGVSVDTVKGVSSPREKTGMHVVKRSQEIETLSGNIVHLEQNGEPAALAATNGVGERASVKLLTRWRKSLGRCCDCWPSMRCLVCRTDRKGLAWPGKQARSAALVTEDPSPTDNVPTGCWTKFKNRCRCKRLRELKCCSKRSRIAPAEASVCCPPERRFGAICRRLFDRCKCRRNSDTERTRNIRAKHSLTSVAPPPLSEEPKAKIPDVLVEHNSLMRGAIPCLPVPLAWFCLVWNVLLPGSGTVWSGIFNLCTGQPRFSPVAGLKSRLGAFVVNLIVGVGQLFTVLFCLVGWGWSIWWGVTLVRLARKYKRFKASEAANNDPEARGGEQTALPPGVPSQALRGMERTR